MMVDLLTKRSLASEQTLQELQAAFALVSDPAPVLQAVSGSAAELDAAKVRQRRLEEQTKALQQHVLSAESEIASLRSGGGASATGGGGAPAAAVDEEVRGDDGAIGGLSSLCARHGRRTRACSCY